MFQYLVINHNSLGYGTIGSVMTPRNRAYWGLTYDISNIGLSLGGGLWTSGDNRAQDYLFVPHYSAGTIMGSGQQNEPYKYSSQGLSWS